MDQTQLVIAMHQNGIGIPKIVKILNISEYNIYEILYANGFSHLKDKNLERDKAICEDYINGEKITALAEKNKIDRHTITAILKSHKVYKGNRHAGYYSQEKKERTDEIVKLYQQGLSFRQIAKKFGICTSTVKNTLQAMNVQIRSQHMPGHSKGTTKNRKYFFDIDFFEKIDTEEKAYWLGFLYADGYVAYRGVVQMALKQDDKSHLEAFRKTLGDENVKISFNSKTKSCSIWFSSVKMAEDLIKLGCKQKKSLTLEFPNNKQVPDNLIHHFMRGYFDGDGCILTNSHSPQFSILGTPSFLDEYEKIMLKNLKNKKKTKRIIRDNWNVNTQQIMYSGRLRVLDIYSFLYKDATIYLKRKKEKFEELKRRPEMSSQKSLDD